MTGTAVPTARRVLDRTARSFALSVRALPRAVREPVEVAYLLARAADTVADSPLAGAPDGAARAASLAGLRAALRDGGAGWHPAGLVDPASPEETALLASADRLLGRYRGLPAGDRGDVRDVVDRLAATMEDELRAFPGPDLRALPDAAALAAYTEGIAGCVGAFWTRLLVRHGAVSRAAAPALERAGRRYGRGLQLVNVLRDLPRDLRRGRCFLPAGELREAGLVPADLLDPAALPRLAPVLARWERRARAGLLAGLLYTARLPARRWGVRVATALPARLGLLTLDRLAAADAPRLDPDVSIRIGRADVRRALVATAAWSLVPRGPLRLAR